LLAKIEANLIREEPEVQCAMNFTAGRIGVHDEKYRERCFQIGEKQSGRSIKKTAGMDVPAVAPAEKSRLLLPHQLLTVLSWFCSERL